MQATVWQGRKAQSNEGILMMIKKLLLGTTALASAALLSPEAFSADPPKLSFLGYYRFEAYATNQNFRGSRGGRQFHVESDDVELQFRAEATADNGLKYQAYIEVDLDNTQLNVSAAGVAPQRVPMAVADEANLRFQGDWGILDLGDQDGAEDTMTYGAENFFFGQGASDGDISSIINTRSVGSAMGPDLLGDSGDATKITYYTPRVMGFQFGVSYTPDTGHDLGEPVLNDDTAEYRNNWGFGLNYTEKYGDFTVGAAIVGISAIPDKTVTSSGSTSTDIEDAMSYSIGGFVTWKEWSVGGHYGDSGSTGLNKGRGTGNDA
ncbi:MAG: porin, partial [Rhodospirillales bacterium]|nr:porin [Rhodospirillales bacterium]